MPITNADPHHWFPAPEIVEWLAAKYKGKRVLEIGPGQARFPAATYFVDLSSVPEIPPEQMTKIDVGRDSLPFSDLKFWASDVASCFAEKWDFCYARHVLEDMANPFHLIAEMSRVAKAGYIETPSPICELARGVDAGSPLYRGYNHHRWIVWDNDGELTFIAKYPIVEYRSFADETLDEQRLRLSARYWNTSYLWECDIKVRHLQCPHDFRMPEDYGATLLAAKAQSKTSIDKFYGIITNEP